MSLYLILNLASISIPLLYSFEKKMYFIAWWKEVFTSIFIVGFLFILWDVYFTTQGIWGFNSRYLIGINLMNLPIEEWLFFICIPYASIFTHYALRYFWPKFQLNQLITNIFSLILLILLIFVIFYNYEKAYTFYNFLLLIILLLYSLFLKKNPLNSFYISFLIILIPFFLVNGILTGSFIEEQVVWYNNSENTGIRLFTIPVEDVGYAFNLLFMNIVLIERLKNKKASK